MGRSAIGWAALLLACSARDSLSPADDGWSLPTPSQTGVRPLPGIFADTGAFRAGFTVLQSAAGDYISYSDDAFRYDQIPIVDGAFSFAHGGGHDGTTCPTDGYAIS